MIDRLIASIVDESRWLTLSMTLALLAAGALVYRHVHARRAVGWAIVGLAAVVNVGLFVGSVIFFLSGQSFEQFQGMP